MGGVSQKTSVLFLNMQALASVTGRQEASIKADAAKAGDLSAIANTARSKQATLGRIATNTVRSVFK